MMLTICIFAFCSLVLTIDEDFESNYYRANKIKVKKVIVQGQSSKFYDRWKGFRKSTPSGDHFRSKMNFEKIKHLTLSGHHRYEWRLCSTWCLEHF